MGSSSSRHPHLRGLSSLQARRGAIAMRSIACAADEMRTWVGELLEGCIHGKEDARATMIAWASALVPHDDAELSMRLRRLGTRSGAAVDLSVAARAFLNVTSAPSRARRMPTRGRLHAPCWAKSTVVLGWHRVVEIPRERQKLEGELLDPTRPWLRGLDREQIAALTAEQNEALWEPWAGANAWPFAELPTTDISLMRGAGPRDPWMRGMRRAASRHPSLSVRRRILEEPGMVERDVVEMAARRPTRAGLLLAIAARDRWLVRRKVRDALVRNPYTPSWLVAALLPIASPTTCREITQRHDDPNVMAFGRALQQARRPC